MVCKKCGKDIQDNALFCGYCGEKCEEKWGWRVCKVCGAELMQNMQYCHVCGSGIENNTKIDEVQPEDGPDKEKVSGDEKHKLILFIIIGVCIGLMFENLFSFIFRRVFDVDYYYSIQVYVLKWLVKFTAILMGLSYGTFRVWRSYRNSNKQIKVQDVVICVVFAIISIGADRIVRHCYEFMN